MSSGAARWALAHLDGWTWLIAEYRLGLITLTTVTGLAVPLLVAYRKRLPLPAPSLVIRSGAMALAFLRPWRPSARCCTSAICAGWHRTSVRPPI